MDDHVASPRHECAPEVQHSRVLVYVRRLSCLAFSSARNSDTGLERVGNAAPPQNTLTGAGLSVTGKEEHAKGYGTIEKPSRAGVNDRLGKASGYGHFLLDSRLHVLC